MRIDVLSIFPDYLAPLELSLPGKARERGLLDLRVHDLREFTHDRHRTTDDTPYGGGAGMVMRPEPWGEALDALEIDGATVVVPSPSGSPFDQATARELASRERLVFACGRYEGIDQRVLDHVGERAELRELSLGDYVLNGGEVAALAIIEAVVRLLPGFMGNPDSLTEESHEDGLLEYPVYTKPPTWRGLTVPDVLLSGNHAAIAAWRHEQAVRRTVARRPDLAHPASSVAGEGLPEGAAIRLAEPADAGEILTLQLACGGPEQDGPVDPESTAVLGTTSFVLRAGGRLLGMVACRSLEDGTVWCIDNLLVVPDLAGRGLAERLLEHAEGAAPTGVTTYLLRTGATDLRGFRKAGYRLRGGDAGAGLAELTRPRR